MYCRAASSDIILAIITEGCVPKTALITSPTKRRCFDEFVDLLSTDIINIIYETEKYGTYRVKPVKHVYYSAHDFEIMLPELRFEINRPFGEYLVEIYGLREMDDFRLPSVPFEVEEFVESNNEMCGNAERRACFGIYLETRFPKGVRVEYDEQYLGYEHAPVRSHVMVSLKRDKDSPSKMKVVRPLRHEQC